MGLVKQDSRISRVGCRFETREKVDWLPAVMERGWKEMRGEKTPQKPAKSRKSGSSIFTKLQTPNTEISKISIYLAWKYKSFTNLECDEIWNLKIWQNYKILSYDKIFI